MIMVKEHPYCHLYLAPAEVWNCPNDLCPDLGHMSQKQLITSSSPHQSMPYIGNIYKTDVERRYMRYFSLRLIFFSALSN